MRTVADKAISMVKTSACRIRNRGSWAIELLDYGVKVAKQHEAEYRYIECQLGDMEELDRPGRADLTVWLNYGESKLSDDARGRPRRL